MTDAMQVLFLYAQEHMVCSLLSQEHEYANVRLCVEKQGEAFRALLDETTRERFDNLLDEQNLLSSFYGRALFRAGFQIAMELSARV